MTRELERTRRTERALRYLALVAVMLVGVLSIVATGGGSGSNNAGGTPTLPPAIELTLTPFVTGLNAPVGVYSAGSGEDRLFVIEQAGVIRIVQPTGSVLATPFLDISGRVLSGGEQGLLGLAFDPNYATNGFFYVNYTARPDGTTRISRFTVGATDGDVADPSSEDVLLTVGQPFANHNAGDIHFGPDGLLYVPLGDGGSGGDPNNNAQNPKVLLGKVTRIDVDSSTGSAPDCVGSGSGHYTVPAGNPFVDGPGGTCDEIWASGLRNPFRTSLDRLTGDFYIADVGQDEWEEIDVQAAGSAGGQNYGWRCFEGDSTYNASGCGSRSAFTFPVFVYSHAAGDCAVIGGYVYRGSAFPALYGRYVFTDLCTGNFWDMTADGAGGFQAAEHSNLARSGYVSFGEDAQGELYVVHQGSGTLFRLGAM
jgi:glucose/arabinose dehydrogenase